MLQKLAKKENIDRKYVTLGGLSDWNMATAESWIHVLSSDSVVVRHRRGAVYGGTAKRFDRKNFIVLCRTG